MDMGHYDGRYDYYDQNGRYSKYDARSPQEREMGLDLWVDPRKTYDKYVRMRVREPIDQMIQAINLSQSSVDDALQNNRFVMVDARQPQLNVIPRDYT